MSLDKKKLISCSIGTRIVTDSICQETISQTRPDQDNRILTLYYDVNINTIFNRTKLQNIKNKFIKYVNDLIKHEKDKMQSK